ncbi:MAG: hypothetical protein IPK82_23300 [Polyangiaceae bacterium]|nr:hypothetical protein [Polyangiaceae bacterium]
MAAGIDTVAVARVDAGASPVWFNRQGFSGTIPTRTGTGLYTLTMSAGGVDATKGQYFGSLEGSGHISVRPTSDTDLAVVITDATGVAADIDFNVLVTRIFF